MDPVSAHVDYSGQWRFVPQASVLEIPSPDVARFAISHREPHFHLERTLEFGGRGDTFSIDLTIGAPPATLSRGDATLHARVFWDNAQLVFDTQIVRAGEMATNLVRYRLEDQGTTLVAEERFRSSTHNYDNKWVFTKVREST